MRKHPNLLNSRHIQARRDSTDVNGGQPRRNHNIRKVQETHVGWPGMLRSTQCHAMLGNRCCPGYGTTDSVVYIDRKLQCCR